MVTLVLFVFFSTGFFGSIALMLIKRLRRTENELKRKNKEVERRLYELSVSQAVSQQIGYSLHIESVIQSIVDTAEHVIPHSAISYGLVDGATITVKTLEKDFLGSIFTSALQKDLLDEIYKQLPQNQYHVISSVQKEIIATQGGYNNVVPASIFTLPLVINHTCVGAIALSSVKKDAFSQEDTSLLSRIIENTTATVGNLEQVIGTEKSKRDSFLFSLTSGALLFLIEGDVLKLSSINAAAKQFLHVQDNPDTSQVIAHFGMHYDLIQDIKDVAGEKKSMIIKDVSIYDRGFKIYLNPVFLEGADQIIGVAVTMEDVTFERDVERLRETFTSMIVHELRAPLTSIKGASDLLLSGSLKKEDMDKMLHIVHDSTERMLMDIGDILDVSKLEAGKFMLNKSISDINTLVTEKVMTFSFTANMRHIKISSNVDTGIPQFVFDPQRVGQVLNNLLSNALKFTPDNGSITVTTTSRNDQITVSVHDTGVGVPPEKMVLLFSKYGQLAGGLRKEGGTGLGLYISKGIVESHGGKIWLEDGKGKGATFSFTLPLTTKLDEIKAEKPSLTSISSVKTKPQIPASRISQKTVN